MDSRLYEEVCRRFVARAFGVPLEAVTSPRIPNPKRPNMPEYAHQIDLYWEVSNSVALYLHIANAKWRGSEKVKEGEVLLLQKVREKVSAHKALMIASSGFTAGAVAVAKDEGIGLHVVRPDFDHAAIPLGDRAAMQSALSEVSCELYSHEVVHRGLDLAERPAPIAPAPRPSPGYTTRQVTSYTTREGPGPGYTNRSLGGGSSSGGGPAGPGRSSGGDGGFTTRDGGGGFTRGGGGFERR